MLSVLSGCYEEIFTPLEVTADQTQSFQFFLVATGDQWWFSALSSATRTSLSVLSGCYRSSRRWLAYFLNSFVFLSVLSGCYTQTQHQARRCQLSAFQSFQFFLVATIELIKEYAQFQADLELSVLSGCYVWIYGYKWGLGRCIRCYLSVLSGCYASIGEAL